MSGGNDSDKLALYKQGKKLVYKAKKLEKKNKVEKAKKIYFKAYDKFEKAYSKDKKNPDLWHVYRRECCETKNILTLRIKF